MRKILLFASALMLGSSLNAQIFSDNFDSYAAGDYLGLSNPEWSTWSNQPGGSEDVKISDVDAASGPNSLHFLASSANGGPADVILKFEEVYTTGSFELDFNMKVVTGKGAYFNLQQNHTVGQVWALQGYFLQNGAFKFDNGSTGDVLLEGSYPNGEWFNLKLEVDLTTNVWDVIVDGVSAGTFSNPVNSIGIWDIFPVNPAQMGGNGQSEFFIDDVSYNHIPAALPALNAGVTYVKPIFGLAGQSLPVSAKVRNVGEDVITSFDLTYAYTGGISVTESVSGLTLASLATYEYEFTQLLALASGSNPLTVTVSNVNGNGADDDASDDAKSINIEPLVPAAGKVVVGEEGTGTWCGWCPRGAVFMDYMAEKYEGFWAGIAVHNGDPMVHPAYDAGIGSKIQGYPSALVDRGTAIDPSALEEDFIQRILIAPKAVISNGASFDPATRELTVSLTYDFISPISGNWKVACVLTEDGVTGTANGYAQVNYYAGGGSGEMGGYESLPATVPASSMVYDHVARTIVPSFAGGTGLLPSSTVAGDKHTVCFKFTIPTEWNIENMNIVGMLIAANGKIDNGSHSTVSDAISAGLAECDATLGVVENSLKEQSFNIYPNPANEMAFIDVDFVKGNDVVLTISDLTGKVVATRSYVINEKVQLPINTSTFSKGTYIVRLQQGGVVQQKKLIVQ